MVQEPSECARGGGGECSLGASLAPSLFLPPSLSLSLCCLTARNRRPPPPPVFYPTRQGPNLYLIVLSGVTAQCAAGKAWSDIVLCGGNSIKNPFLGFHQSIIQRLSWTARRYNCCGRITIISFDMVSKVVVVESGTLCYLLPCDFLERWWPESFTFIDCSFSGSSLARSRAGGTISPSSYEHRLSLSLSLSLPLSLSLFVFFPFTLSFYLSPFFSN